MQNIDDETTVFDEIEGCTDNSTLNMTHLLILIVVLVIL